MGNTDSIQKFEVSKPLPSSWAKVATCADFDLLKNSYTGEEIQEYVVEAEVGLQQQFKIYEIRKHQKENIVAVINAEKIEEDYICVGREKIRVRTEYIQFRLSQISILNYQQSLYVLEGSLIGFKAIFEFAGYVTISEELIGFNKLGQVRVWLNQNFGKNHCDFRRESRVGNQQGLAQRMISQLVHLIEDFTIKGEFSEWLKEYFENECPNNFAQAIKVVRQFVLRQRVMIPSKINFNASHFRYTNMEQKTTVQNINIQNPVSNTQYTQRVASRPENVELFRTPIDPNKNIKKSQIETFSDNRRYGQLGSSQASRSGVANSVNYQPPPIYQVINKRPEQIVINRGSYINNDRRINQMPVVYQSRVQHVSYPVINQNIPIRGPQNLNNTRHINVVSHLTPQQNTNYNFIHRNQNIVQSNVVNRPVLQVRNATIVSNPIYLKTSNPVANLVSENQVQNIPIKIPEQVNNNNVQVTVIDQKNPVVVNQVIPTQQIIHKNEQKQLQIIENQIKVQQLPLKQTISISESSSQIVEQVNKTQVINQQNNQNKQNHQNRENLIKNNQIQQPSRQLQNQQKQLQTHYIKHQTHQIKHQAIDRQAQNVNLYQKVANEHEIDMLAEFQQSLNTQKQLNIEEKAQIESEIKAKLNNILHSSQDLGQGYPTYQENAIQNRQDYNNNDIYTDHMSKQQNFYADKYAHQEKAITTEHLYEPTHEVYQNQHLAATNLNYHNEVYNIEDQYKRRFEYQDLNLFLNKNQQNKHQQTSSFSRNINFNEQSTSSKYNQLNYQIEEEVQKHKRYLRSIEQKYGLPSDQLNHSDLKIQSKIQSSYYQPNQEIRNQLYSLINNNQEQESLDKKYLSRKIISAFPLTKEVDLTEKYQYQPQQVQYNFSKKDFNSYSEKYIDLQPLSSGFEYTFKNNFINKQPQLGYNPIQSQTNISKTSSRRTNFMQPSLSYEDLRKKLSQQSNMYYHYD